MFEELIAQLKGKNRRLVFTEGSEPRILSAAVRLHQQGILVPVLLGDPAEIQAAAKEGGFDIEGIDAEACRAALSKSNYFGTMLVKIGYVDCLLGGATYSTADTVRPALQLIKTKPGNKIVSSCFIMYREKDGKEEKYAMGDCAINIAPNEDELVEITMETARTARLFGIDPKVALLSYSSLGSGKGDSVTLMQNATAKVKELNPDFPVDGELQFDAAFSPEVAKTKAKGSAVAGHANTFIFPDVDAGNIGYKIGQRLGGFEAYGPLLQGLNAPINDLSRGCNAEEVYKMAIITASQK